MSWSRSTTWLAVTITPSSDQTRPLAPRRRRASTRTTPASAAATVSTNAADRAFRTSAIESSPLGRKYLYTDYADGADVGRAYPSHLGEDVIALVRAARPRQLGVGGLDDWGGGRRK